MKILILSKRQYTNLDLIDNRYGRIRELPLALAKLGHEITGFCLSYRSRSEGIHTDVDNNACVTWHSLDLKRLFSFGPGSYLGKLNSIFQGNKPDLIWATSDALHIILGACVAKRYKTHFVADLYDNYESFPVIRLTGGKKIFRYALKHADGLTCVSRPLARYIRETTAFDWPLEVIENAVRKDIFYPMDKFECRRELGLSDKGFYIGTAGAISKSRGIEVLIDAFQILAQQNPDIHLVLAGSCDKDLALPQNSRIHYLGILPPDRVPVFLSALDVQIICNKDSEFGRYCFPQKFYEAVACRVPIVATDVGAMHETLNDNPGHLFKPGDVIDLVSVLQRQMKTPSPLPIDAVTWDNHGKKLETFFQTILSR